MVLLLPPVLLWFRCCSRGVAWHPCLSCTGIPVKSTPVGFEPTRGDPIGLAGRRLSRSAKVSSAWIWGKLLTRQVLPLHNPTALLGDPSHFQTLHHANLPCPQSQYCNGRAYRTRPYHTPSFPTRPFTHPYHTTAILLFAHPYYTMAMWLHDGNVHQPGIEPGSHRWQRCILPLDHSCLCESLGSVSHELQGPASGPPMAKTVLCRNCGQAAS